MHNVKPALSGANMIIVLNSDFLILLCNELYIIGGRKYLEMYRVFKFSENIFLFVGLRKSQNTET